MAPPTRSSLFTWTTVLPVAALLVLAATWGRHLGPVLTVVVAALTVAPGRGTRLQGAVHLVLLAGFLFLAVNP